MTIVVMTHAADIAAYAARVVTMRDGGIVSEAHVDLTLPSIRADRPYPGLFTAALEARNRLTGLLASQYHRAIRITGCIGEVG